MAGMAGNLRHPLMSAARLSAVVLGVGYGMYKASAVRAHFQAEQTAKVHQLEKEVRDLRGEVASSRAGAASLDAVSKGQATIDQWIGGLAAK